jgi:putative NIF3 family GTP cyclohydrolase 1 type 2
VKYSVFLDAQGCGINLIDAGHFPTENPITAKLQRKLQTRFPELQVALAKNISQPDQFF